MRITFRLEPSIEKRLSVLAKRTGRTKSYYLRELIVNGIDDLERFYQQQQVRDSQQAVPQGRRTAPKPRREEEK